MKKIISLTISLSLLAFISYGQKENASIRNGNKLYKQSNFDQSVNEYKKAVATSPINPIANYNLGNAEFRTNQLPEAVNSYEASISNSLEKPVKEKAFYNKGVAYSKQQKLQESIDAWKNALKLDPNDQEARENLQKALLEQKKQQEKDDQKKDDKQKEKKKDQKNQNKDQQKPQPQQPQQQQSRLSKKQVEQLLKALAQKEKEVQQKMQSKNTSPSSQDKDW